MLSTLSASEPQSQTAAKVSFYDKTMSEDYKSLKSVNPYFVHEKHTLNTLIGDLTGKDVVDLACGDGHYTRHFKARGAKSMLGIDISEHMVQLARATEAKLTQGIRYIEHDCMNMQPLQLPKFDLALACWLLNYMSTREQLQEAVRSVASIVKLGGAHVGMTINPFMSDLATDTYQPSDPAWLRLFGNRIYRMPGREGKKFKDGEVVNVEIAQADPAQPPLHLEVIYWSPETYEAAFQEAGFGQFRWQRILLSPDLDPAQRAAWKPFFSNPNAIAYKAIKTQ
eukprot:g2305.t1